MSWQDFFFINSDWDNSWIASSMVSGCSAYNTVLMCTESIYFFNKKLIIFAMLSHTFCTQGHAAFWRKKNPKNLGCFKTLALLDFYLFQGAYFSTPFKALFVVLVLLLPYKGLICGFSTPPFFLADWQDRHLIYMFQWN